MPQKIKCVHEASTQSLWKSLSSAFLAQKQPDPEHSEMGRAWPCSGQVVPSTQRLRAGQRFGGPCVELLYLLFNDKFSALELVVVIRFGKYFRIYWLLPVLDPLYGIECSSFCLCLDLF